MNALTILNTIPTRNLTENPLTQEERRLCVQHMSYELENAKGQSEQAQLLGVCTRTIREDVKWLRDHAIAEIAPIVTEEIVKDMMVAKNHAQTLALRKGDVRLYWDIEMDVIEKLGRMGYIPYKYEPINFQIGDRNETNVVNITAIAGSPAELNRAIDETISRIATLRELAHSGNGKE